MLKHIYQLAALLLAVSITTAQAQRTVTDSAGRTVTVPDRIERVFAAGPPASIFLYVLAPEKLLGWPRPPHADEAAFLAEPYRDLPELGRLTGRGDTANIEVALAAKPDLIFDFGSVAPTYISLADRVQEQTGIPYILIDGTFANTVASLRLLGSILGVGERAEELAKYTEKAFSELDQALTQIPQEKRPKVYFARGPEGLETGVRGSINTEIIERVGAINVADAPGQRGLANISVEQVIVWNPDTIVTLDERFFAGLEQNPLWQGVDAVLLKRVYLAPDLPFGWVDRPPALNRLIGLEWLARLFYPDYFKDDMRSKTREFFLLFYHLDLTDAQLAQLLR
jgi:iron complex transport system substrate-binding protein